MSDEPSKLDISDEMIAERRGGSQKMPDDMSVLHNYHKYVVRFENKEIRDEVKDELDAKIHYDKPLSANSIFKLNPCPNAQIASDTLLSLPCHPYVTDEEVSTTAMVIGVMA